MAAKTQWSGALMLAPGITMYLEASVGIERLGSGVIPLKEVCECHHEPFTTEKRCAQSGKLRRTGEGKKVKGEVEMVKAAARPDGSYAVVDEALIERSLPKDEMPLLAVKDLADLPPQATDAFWTLSPSKNVPGADQAVGLILTWLEAQEKALIVRMRYGAHSYVCAIHAVEEGLGMSRVRFPAELRPCPPIRKNEDPRMLAMLDTLLGSLPSNFSLSEIDDPDVAARNAVIEAAIGGTLAEAAKVEAPTAAPAPDLMAQLEASLAAAQGEPTNASASKVKVKA